MIIQSPKKSSMETMLLMPLWIAKGKKDHTPLFMRRLTGIHSMTIALLCKGERLMTSGSALIANVMNSTNKEFIWHKASKGSLTP